MLLIRFRPDRLPARQRLRGGLAAANAARTARDQWRALRRGGARAGFARGAAAGIQRRCSFRLREAGSISVVATLPAAPLTSLPMRFRFDLRPAWRMARMIREQHFDLIHTHTPRAILVGAIASRLTGVPLVHHVHGHTAIEVGSGWRLRLAAEIESISLSQASAVIAVSPTAAEYIAAWGVPAERIQVVPNGVPGRTAIVDRHDAVFDVDDWHGRIVTAAKRFGSAVGSRIAIASRGVPVRLRVIGGFETPEYEREVRQLADR